MRTSAAIFVFFVLALLAPLGCGSKKADPPPKAPPTSEAVDLEDQTPPEPGTIKMK